MSSSTVTKKPVVRHSKSQPTASSSAVTTSAAPSPEVSVATPVIAAAAAAPPITPPGDLPLTEAVPAPRAGWQPAPGKKRGVKGLRPKAIQATNAEAVAKELTQSATYTADFGARAPAAGQVAFLVTNAAKWRATWAATKTLLAYASEQRAAWENEALAQMDALKPSFEYAASRDATVEEKYAATSKYLGATNAIAARGAASRKAKKGASGTKVAAPETAETPAAAVAEPVAAPVGK